MSHLWIVQAVSGLLALAVAIIVSIHRRFGASSWFLAFYLLLAAASAGILAIENRVPLTETRLVFRLAYSLLLLSAPAGLCAALTLAREDPWAHVRKRLWLVASAYTVPLALLPWLLDDSVAIEALRTVRQGQVPVGLPGYAGALYLIVVSILVLASLERTLQSAQEHVRWEIKFVIIGLYATFAAHVYVASRALLFPPTLCALSWDTLRVFPFVLLCNCILILMSLGRISGRGQVRVSQGLIYASVTYIGVGFYLLATSVVAAWAGSLANAGIETQAVVFLLSGLLFAVFVLSTRVRHRARYWIRRNLYSGQYDYRSMWLEASERIRSSDPPGRAASMLASLITKAIHAIDVSIWLRGSEPGIFRLLAVKGCTYGPPPSELAGLETFVVGLEKPVQASALQGQAPADVAELLVRTTSAALIVPLKSGGETLGFATVGHDRSGRPYDIDAHEFLRVMANHAAGEFHKAELLKMQVDAKEAEAFRSFSIFLLHDLKNFASTLSLIATNAVRHQGNPEFQKDAFQSIYDTAEKIKRLCNSLRTFAADPTPARTLIDLNETVRGVVSAFDGALASKIRLDLGQIPCVRADDAAVSRVLRNLILNASEAITSNGSITVRTAPRDGKIELTVADNGKGIAREFLEKELFQPFRTTKTNGLGIGLFQSKKIMEAHGGTIRVESQEGSGALVTAAFPVPLTPFPASPDESKTEAGPK
jgi:putative PEP-CTERM system histidine kinase